MVGRRRKRKTSQPLMGNHQRCWLWGRHAVLEMLRSGRWLPLELCWVPEALPADVQEEVDRLALMHGLHVYQASAAELDHLCGRQEHQGLAAQMPEFPYASLADLLQECAEVSHPFVLLLDRIQDPYNLGAILRSAEVLGAQGVIVPEHHQAAISSHVVRSSAGAVHHLTIARVPSLTQAAQALQEAGFFLAGASEKGTTPPDQADLRGSLALVVGNEGSGPDPDLLECCQSLLCIPQAGQVSSLNAAVAAGILCYEVARQRRQS